MTTFVQFAPTTEQAFSFSAALDGGSFQITVVWSLFGQRWYVACVGTNGTLIFYLPLIGSPDAGDINLAGGYFNVSTLVFRESSQSFEITP